MNPSLIYAKKGAKVIKKIGMLRRRHRGGGEERKAVARDAKVEEVSP